MDKFMNACLIGSLVFMLGLAGAETYEFGSKVALDDTDIGHLLYNIAPNFEYWDLGPAGYDQGDIVYLHLGTSGCQECGDTISPNDIRITSFGALAAGTKVTANDNDINKPLGIFDGGWALRFTNLYGGPGYDFEDPVYLHIGPGTSTTTNDIRLNKIDGLDAGTKVLDYHGDHDKPLSGLPDYAIRFFNANGNYNGVLPYDPLYDFADSVYLDFSMKTQLYGFVSVNDVRLSV